MIVGFFFYFLPRLSFSTQSHEWVIIVPDVKQKHPNVTERQNVCEPDVFPLELQSFSPGEVFPRLVCF